MLYSQIQAAIKEAMKSKNVVKRDALKMVVNKSQAIAKEKKIDISDDVVLDGIQRELKQLNQTKDSLAGKEDCDLYKTTMEKIQILQSYLPKMMSEDEITAFVESELIELTSVNVQISPKIKGMVMKNIMPQLKGKADGKLVNTVIDRLLSSK